MPDEEIKFTSMGYVRFADMQDPKLSWIIRRFDREGINYKIAGQNIKGNTIVKVDFDQYYEAWQLLDEEIGSLNIDNGGSITWSDLPDSHPIFALDAEAPSKGEPDPNDIAELPCDTQSLPGVDKAVMMYEVSSSNLSAMGLSMPDDNLRVLYVRFKGGTIYRYYSITDQVWRDLSIEAVKAQKGVQEASVGSLFHHAIKVPADEGKLNCHKLDDENIWRVVLPKTQRKTVVDKYKKRSGK